MTLVFAACVLAQTVAPAVRAPEVLRPSGTRLLVVPRPEARTVAIAAAFHVGSALDGAATCGCAHLLEHVLLFRGTEFSGEHALAARVRGLGAEVNAATYPDYTLFAISVDRQDVGAAMDLLREMLFHPVFSAAALEREKNVVCAELAIRARDPAVATYNMVTRALYGEHNYGLPALGFTRVIRELSPETLYARIDREMTPDRMTLVVVGPVDPVEVRHFAQETFGSYAPGPARPAEQGELPPLRLNTREVGTSTGTAAQLVFAFRGPPSNDPDWLPFVVMANVLCGGDRTALTERLVYQGGFARSVTLRVEPRLKGGYAEIRVVLEPENVRRCEAELLAALGSILERPPERADVDRALNRLGLEFAQRTESPRTLAEELAGWDALGSWDFPLELRRRLAQVPNERFAWIGRKYFDPERAVVVAVVPEGMQGLVEPVSTEAVRRERRVMTAGAPFPLVAQSLPSTGVYSFALAVRGGLTADAPNEEGLGGVVARAVLQGEEGETAEAFRSKLERWGVVIEAGTARDYTFIRFSAPEGRFRDALTDVSRAIVSPGFRPADLVRVRQEAIAQTATFSSVADAAWRALWREAFDGTPYAVFPPGSRDSLSGLRTALLGTKVRNYWRTWWRPENFAVAVCGPRHVDELAYMVTRAFAPLAQPASAGSEAPPPFVPPIRTPRTVILDRETSEGEKAQTVVLWAWFVPEATVENLAAVLALKEVMAGAPGTRLWRLRQDEGVLYHLKCEVVVTRHVIAVAFSMVLPAENVRLARSLLLKEIARPVDAAELNLARLAVRRAADLRRERGLELVDEDAWFLLAGWERDDLTRALDALTPAALGRTVARSFGPQRLWTVAAGPRGRLEKDLAE